MSACYIVGPMRGVPEYNYPAFFAAEEALAARGWSPIYNPARMDIDEDEEKYAERTLEEQKLHDTAHAARRFARRDVDVLLNKLCAEDGDAIVLLPGWDNSAGARAEHAVAAWVSLRVLTIAAALSTHSDTCRATDFPCPVSAHE
jgi:hypothetical protein